MLGIIGVGYWGKNIMRNLSELGALRAACDSDPGVIADKRKRYPDVYYTADPADILDDPSIKAVLIATPAATHYELVKRALLAGKDVLVEKPLALTLGEGSELVNIAEKENKILMIGHILQYHPAVIKMKELVSAGGLGRIRYIYSNRLNIGKLRIEENVLWSFAPHDISLILMLVGEEPAGVSAFGGSYLSRGIYDTTLTTMDFESGVKAHIFVSWLHPYKEQRLVVVGSEAMACFDALGEDRIFVYPHTVDWIEGKIPVAQKAEKRVIDVEKKEALREEIKHFINCVEKRDIPKTDGREGLRVLKVLEAAEKTLREKI